MSLTWSSQVTSSVSPRAMCVMKWSGAAPCQCSSPGGGHRIRATPTTTQRVGHVAYCRDTMFKRLGINRRTLERHIAVLRELGLLVRAVHDSRTNTRPRPRRPHEVPWW
ncbi:hypothetical protein [Streptomyces sp. NPDC001851]|uniref:hypothetical protein n=1 Tax=Streptomyces sp. NPDC001851 TaxID=3154529 RepID=UPI00332739CD